MQLSKIHATHLVFDCYGTLIDWESGILNALRPFLLSQGCSLSDQEILELYGRFEPIAEAGDFRIYRKVLAQVMRLFGQHFGFQPTATSEMLLAQSIQDWQPFPDTVPALQRLATRFKLNILSNIDRDLIIHSQAHLQVRFSQVMTAQDIGSYKPAPANFHYALQKMAVAPAKVLHVAQSLYHDIAPAQALGLRTIWVNRRKGKTGSGATPPAAVKPDWEINNLADLADLLGC
ncbi:MAG TPA: haloacid dehalogenase type II [Bacteroidetes bacterium]|nr:haloacid dehalogenase type II [Bacteroidota bacterium]